MLDDPNVDAVYICLSNEAHLPWIEASIAAGKHVLCEKPMVLTAEQTERAFALADHAGVHLVEATWSRWHPRMRRIVELATSGALGEILTLRGVYGKAGGYDYPSSWRNDTAVGGGGILLDQGIHMLDLFHLFVGEFSEVQSMRGVLHFDVPVEDNAIVILKTKRGQLAQLHSSATSWKHTFRLEIGCEAGYAVISGLLSKTGSYGRETLVIGRRPARGEETTYYDSDPSWDIEVAHFVDCILGKLPVNQGTSIDAIRVMEIIERVYREPLIKLTPALVKAP